MDSSEHTNYEVKISKEIDYVEDGYYGLWGVGWLEWGGYVKPIFLKALPANE